MSTSAAAVSVIIWQPVACPCSSERAALPSLAASIFKQPACTVASWAPYQRCSAEQAPVLGFAALASAKCRSALPCFAVQHLSFQLCRPQLISRCSLKFHPDRGAKLLYPSVLWTLLTPGSACSRNAQLN